MLKTCGKKIMRDEMVDTEMGQHRRKCYNSYIELQCNDYEALVAHLKEVR